MPAALEPAAEPSIVRLSDHRGRGSRRLKLLDETAERDTAREHQRSLFPEADAGDGGSQSDVGGESLRRTQASSGQAERIEHLVEYANSQGFRPQVDASAGVITGVKVLGAASRNGRVYRPSAMSAAASLYEGVKVNVNHPKGGAAAPRDYQDRLGCLRNVRVQEGGLFADLHFNPHHPIAAQLAWDAQWAPENVGLSHNVQARTSRQDGQTIVEQILRVNSVDLVADPATTVGLFESLGEEPASAATMPSQTATDAADGARADALQEAQQQLFEQRRRLEQMVKDARLPPEAASAQFLEHLSILDESAAKALILERASFYRSLAAARPKSKGPEPEARPHDVRHWARLIT